MATILEQMIPLQRKYHNILTQIQVLMLKPTKKRPHNFQNMQDGVPSLETRKPYEQYNMFVRKEGEKVLTEEEYNQKVDEINKARNSIDSISRKEEYPLTPDECFPATKEDFEEAKSKKK